AGHRVEIRQANFAFPTNAQTYADYLFGLPNNNLNVKADAVFNGATYVDFFDSGTVNAFGSVTAAQAYRLNDPGIRVLSGGFAAVGSNDNWALQASRYIFFPTTGTWVMNVWADDGFRLLMGRENAQIAINDNSGGYADISGNADILTPGWYHYTLQFQ